MALTGAASARSSLVLEFIPKPVTVRNVHGLHFLELFEELAGGLGVVAVALKFGDHLPLARNELLAFGHVPFGLR
jgi:hypothetical protein